ncbi:hypothetical protein G9A89_002501 [Geosiphon pyriformis]|nr:hypothetical protein G9A89_002501 [Geosiphon pyriformis]
MNLRTHFDGSWRMRNHGGRTLPIAALLFFPWCSQFFSIFIDASPSFLFAKRESSYAAEQSSNKLNEGLVQNLFSHNETIWYDKYYSTGLNTEKPSRYDLGDTFESMTPINNNNIQQLPVNDFEFGLDPSSNQNFMLTELETSSENKEKIFQPFNDFSLSTGLSSQNLQNKEEESFEEIVEITPPLLDSKKYQNKLFPEQSSRKKVSEGKEQSGNEKGLWEFLFGDGFPRDTKYRQRIMNPNIRRLLITFGDMTKYGFCFAMSRGVAYSPDLYGLSGYDIEKKEIYVILSYHGKVGKKLFFTEEKPPPFTAYKPVNGSEILLNQLLYQEFLLARKNFTQQIRPLIQDGYTIHITSWGVGAAFAVLCALAITEEFSQTMGKVNLYTFGQPRIGNENFAKYVNSRVQAFRVTRKHDEWPITPSFQYGFVHHNTEYWISSPFEVRRPNKGPLYMCNAKSGEESPDCTNSEILESGYVSDSHQHPFFGLDMSVIDCYHYPPPTPLFLQNSKTGFLVDIECE